jgi:hypothetical protein
MQYPPPQRGRFIGTAQGLEHSGGDAGSLVGWVERSAKPIASDEACDLMGFAPLNPSYDATTSPQLLGAAQAGDH